MFDKNTLSQLTKLKEEIIASRDIGDGVVVGANGRFGFVKLDDGRTAFLNPERMQRVLPGDRVRVNIVKNDKDQLEAELEELLQTNTERFVGRYRIKGTNHFVETEGQTSGRWLFIPPQFRKKCAENDYVLTEINKHPYDDGKASVKIVARIGAIGDDYLQHNLIIAQFGLHRSWSKDSQKQVEDIIKDLTLTDRDDFTHLPFVTIDSASTRDMDDAVYVQTNDSGWRLWVAIADPGHFIQPGTPLAKAARNFGQSVYLPGRPLSMLPENLATDTFSLTPQTRKPALIAQIDIASDGTVQHYQFQYGVIQSQHKLSYHDVGLFRRQY
jgi:exoribonuclease II